MPRSPLGRWAVGLIIAMPIMFVIGSSLSGSLYESVPAGRNLLTDVAARPFLSLAMLAGMGAGVSAFIVGLLAIIKHKDHALLVYVSTVIGGLVILLLVGQLAFPQ